MIPRIPFFNRIRGVYTTVSGMRLCGADSCGIIWLEHLHRKDWWCAVRILERSER